MNKSPRVSIILVNWNVRDLLRDCLTSIKEEMQLPRDQYEIIVVDNASTDGSVEMLQQEFPEVRLLASQENLGFGAGCDAGYQLSSGAFILLLNPDTVVIDHAIDRMLAEMERHSEAGVMGCRLLNGDHSFQRAAGGAFPTLKNVAWNYLFLNRLLPKSMAPPAVFIEGDPQGVFDIDWVSGASMLLRREAVGERIFDESFFMFGEDCEVCERMRREGWRVLYTSEATVIHYQGQSYEKQSSVEVMSLAIKGPRAFFEKNHTRGAVFLYDLILLAAYLVRWPAFRLMAMARPGQGFGRLSVYSRKYVFIMLGLLWKTP